jgi:hypothetical protein
MRDFTSGWSTCVSRSFSMLVAVVRDETKRFTQERDSLANSVTLGKDVLDVGRERRVVLGGRMQMGEVVCAWPKCWFK